MTSLPTVAMTPAPVCSIEMEFNREGHACRFHHVGDASIGILAVSGRTASRITRMLAGLSMEARGTIRLKDRLWQDSEKAVFVAARDREIGFVPPEDGLFPHLDIENNLIAGIDRADRLPKENRISPTRVINTLELAKVRMSYRRELKRRDLSDLNAYERRRVSLAMALISSPAMLIIDDGEGPEAAARSHMMKEDYLKVMATWPELPIIIASPDPELVAAMKNSYGASAERVDPISSTRLGPHPSPGADPTTTAGVSSPIA